MAKISRSGRRRSIGQTEHALGDDVELNLARATLDGIGARAEPGAGARKLARVEPLTLPAEPLITEDLDHELAAPFVQLGAVQLEHRRFRARPASRFGSFGRPAQRDFIAVKIH